MKTIENQFLSVSVREKGAELASIISKESGNEFVLQVKKGGWPLSSPVLFPIIGCVKNNKLIHKGKEYDMHIHGFAHYQEFEVSCESSEELRFTLASNGRFLEKYPFEFELILGYKLSGKSVVCSFEVVNKSDEDMYFQVGGHTAYICPLNENENRNQCYLGFEGTSAITTSRIDMSCGLLLDKKEQIELTSEGLLKIEDDLFKKDALVIEGNQVHEVKLLDSNKKAYMSVEFDAPLFGVWSIGDKVAPFVCIEPWYGRCDKKTFDGEIKDREWINRITPSQKFYKEYKINIFD